MPDYDKWPRRAVIRSYRHMEEVKENVLITGGAGFVGSHLTDRLIKDGHRVTIIDNLSLGKREFVNEKAEFVRLDVVKDGKKLKKVIEKLLPTVVFHLAAHKAVRVSVEHPDHDAKENVIGTLNVLGPLRDLKTGVRVVFASTAAVYSPTNTLPIKETAFIQPESPYGIAKRSAEMYLWHFSSMYPIAGISLRFANIYGPRETFGSGSVITRFAKQIAAGKQCTVYGTGEQTRDFIYVDDIVEGLVRSMRVAWCGELNLSTTKETSVNEVHSTIHDIIGTSIDPLYIESKDGDIFQSVLDAKLAKEVMGWEAKIGIREGIEKTVNWCNEMPNECTNNN